MKLKLVNIRDESADTKTFFFEPAEEIEYLAGQYYYFTLPELKYDDKRGETRHFTLSSSPSEEKLISFTTKFPDPMSGYKKTLLETPVGSIFEGRGPQGTFTLENNDGQNTNLFIAGGIGVTPFRSMAKFNYDKKLNHPIYMIYSNSDENFVFGDELKNILSENVELFNTKEKGHLTESAIQELLNRWKLPTQSTTPWVVGSPKFVDAMEASLVKLGISSDTILSEKFTGY